MTEESAQLNYLTSQDVRGTKYLGTELSKELLPLADCYEPRLRSLKRVTPVDGTLLKALPRLAESMWKTSRSGTPCMPGSCIASST